MTDNKVLGYTDQDAVTIEYVNGNKVIEETIIRRIERLGTVDGVNPRFLAIAKTQIEIGFMALNRALFNPQRIDLPED